MESVQKILILSANPKNTSRLRLDQEVREIDQGLQRSRRREEFIIKQQWATRPIDIRRAILDYHPNIIHFCGHGEEEGIILEDHLGHAKLVDSMALAGLFGLFRKEIKCVILNACYSESQAMAIAQHIEYVIGMNKQIQDDLAIEFSTAFYDGLCAGESIEFAYNLGKNAIQMLDCSDYLIPVLIKKSNSTDIEQNNFFDIQISRLQNEDELRQLAALDKIIYSQDYWVSDPIGRKWYNKNSKLWTVAKEIGSQTIIGYVGAFPLSKEIFEKTVLPSYDEISIEPDDIEVYDIPGIYYVYLNSIVVSPAYQKISSVYKKILDGFIDFLIELAEDDIFFAEVSARAVSPIGEKICRSLNMVSVARGENINTFRAKMLPPSLRIISKSGVRLLQLYNDKYQDIKGLFEL